MFRRAKRRLVNTSLVRRLASALLRDYLTLRLELGRSFERDVLAGKSKAPLTVIVLHRGATELTANCLRSLHDAEFAPESVIVVARRFSESARAAIARFSSATALEFPECNTPETILLHATAACTSEFVMWLHDGLEDLSGCIRAAAEFVSASPPDIGLVCGMVVGNAGCVIEAGAVVDRSGQVSSYGYGRNAMDPAYQFAREVDCCTQPPLLIRRQCLITLGANVDQWNRFGIEYSIRLWANGYRVVYSPAFRMLLVDSATVGSVAFADRALPEHVIHTHQGWMQGQRARLVREAGSARQDGDNAKRVLFIEDRVPHARLGSGYPRSNTIVSELVKNDYLVTLYPLQVANESWLDAYLDIPRCVEILLGYGKDLAIAGTFLRERWHEYDLVIVSRPKNMEWLRSSIPAEYLKTFPRKVIYDAEALFANREAALATLRGTPPCNEIQELIRREAALAANCAAVTCVSEEEAAQFRKHAISNVRVLGHALTPRPTTSRPSERFGMLFVGALPAMDCPNADGLTWFVDSVLPLLRNYAKGSIELIVAGNTGRDVRERLQRDGVSFAGLVPDLTPLYERSRVFVAPIRYAAGLPWKVAEAATRGIPIVATSLMASQMGWRSGRELLVADAPDAFARQCCRLLEDDALWHFVRQHALNRVATECGFEEFSHALRQLCDDVTTRAH